MNTQPKPQFLCKYCSQPLKVLLNIRTIDCRYYIDTGKRKRILIADDAYLCPHCFTPLFKDEKELKQHLGEAK